MRQTALFDFATTEKRYGVFPSTRYQGSKSKLTEWIKYYVEDLSFDTALDAFGGTGAIGFMFKQLGKRVYYNDILKSNYYIGVALIENKNIILDNNDIGFLLTKHKDINYPSFIYDTFHDIYFTDEENKWLDIVATNIQQVKDKYKQALAYFALFQACIIKRPYNLFHRKNLYIRNSEVKRSFGNKTTWDTPFETHFLKFIEQGNNAIFSNGRDNKAYCGGVFTLYISDVDLVYIDTPYISTNGVGVNYLDFYHFLEGLVNYNKWRELIDYKSKHKKIRNSKNEWCNKTEITNAFERLFWKFRDSILVVSYRKNGIPSIDTLVNMLNECKKETRVFESDYKYVLSNEKNKEVLIIAE